MYAFYCDKSEDIENLYNRASHLSPVFNLILAAYIYKRPTEALAFVFVVCKSLIKNVLMLV